ncbi:DUF4190 domain-containing protein [Streptomyces luteolifulvus]|uniref:DUF4190 domain-containing protein n=1 Tax=Streptomyces luteolifulvus TaxID=2615112 RepID=A0A6H9V321_9ACTN|nr:DUF4190 domain-containing protein [Streptomyces luteolifulvus]KAB1147692.1 DUF4190 domain-containing protein [Streptomyces luteolifulvus]
MSTPPPPGPHQPPEPYSQGQYPVHPPGPSQPQGPFQGTPSAPYGPPYQLWGQGYSPYNRPAPVNGVAIASLVLGLLCFVPAAGLVLGLIALAQIKKRGERGRGLAVAGSVLSSVGLALWAVSLSTGFVLDVWEGAKNAAKDSASMNKGTCFDSPSGLEGAAYDFDEVPCAGAHDGEVFAVVTLPSGAYPGDDEVTDTADDKCYALQASYAMDAWAVPEDVDVYYLVPTRQSWRLGDHEITCVFGNTEEDAGLTGSLRNDETTLDADQLAYLKAANTQDAALDSAPDATPDDDLSANKEWARRVSDAISEEATMLSGHRWPARARKPVAAVAGELEALRKAWAQAAGAQDVDTFYEHYDHAVTIEDPGTAVTARKALGLDTTPPSYEDDYADPGAGRAGAEAEV